jgi:hypothetical protein
LFAGELLIFRQQSIVSQAALALIADFDLIEISQFLNQVSDRKNHSFAPNIGHDNERKRRNFFKIQQIYYLLNTLIS